MKRNSIQGTRLLALIALFFSTLFLFNTSIHAWGSIGHTATGVLAMSRLEPETRLELAGILGATDEAMMLEACNWPDAVRESAEWEWSAPLHYINIPPGEYAYSQARDCKSQRCATEAIKRYAAELGDKNASQQQRWQAFAWLCHLTGDLHQPLHAGFAHDRGGNNFKIIYQGEDTNLHTFWDSILIERRAGDTQTLVKIIEEHPDVQVSATWSSSDVDRWTEESHALVQQVVYPADSTINNSYENQSWELIPQRINTAASRLAVILNTVLQNQP